MAAPSRETSSLDVGPSREVSNLGGPLVSHHSSLTHQTPDRYDRQLRLWGEYGQASVAKASVLLIHANATGTESLKNLVLPGIKLFHIIDNSPATLRDTGNNFFVTLDQVQQSIPRAEAATALLQELNPDVLGGFTNRSIEEVVFEHTSVDHVHMNSSTEGSGLDDFVSQFSVIIASQTPYNSALSAVYSACWRMRVPLILARSYGQLGFVRVLQRDILITNRVGEGNDQQQDKDSSVTHVDLRIGEEWPELLAFANSFQLDKMDDSAEHAHVPFIVILIHAIHAWRKQYSFSEKGEDVFRFPSTKKERDDLKQIIESWQWSSGEENFAEALKYARYVEKSYIPRSIQSLVDKAESLCPICEEPQLECLKGVTLLASSSSRGPKPLPEAQVHRLAKRRTFWLILRALRRFITEFGRLPTRSHLPDMYSDTESYVRLQSIYLERAESDSKHIMRFMQLEQQESLDRCKLARMDSAWMSPSTIGLGRDHVVHLCKSLRNFDMVPGRSLEDTMRGVNIEVSDLVHGIGEEVNIQHFLLLCAADRFYSIKGRFPGQPKESSRIVLGGGGCSSGGHGGLGENTNAGLVETSSRQSCDDVVMVSSSPPAHMTHLSSQTHEYSLSKRLEQDGAVDIDDENQNDNDNDWNRGNDEIAFRKVLEVVAVEMNLKEAVGMISPDLIQEWIRYGGAELHTVASLVGGVVSQEVVKLLTGQFMPINNTFVFNAVNATCSTFLA